MHATGPLALVLALSGCAAIDAFSGDGHGPDATSVPCTIEPALGAIDSASLTGQAATANGHASTQPGGASPTDDADADAFLPVWRLMFGVD